jgi:hypothetical protein
MARKSPPSYLCHATGQAFSRVNGKNVYFGPHGSPESLARYDDFKRDWLAQHGDIHRYKLTVDELALLYIAHAEQYYRKNGIPTSEVWCVRAALRFLVSKHGTCRVREFGPTKLKKVRQQMIDHGLARKSINKNIDRIRRAFRWGVENEKVPPEILAALAAVRGLAKSRSNAREPDPVKPVPMEHVQAVESQFGNVMLDYYRATGKVEYLERGVAALRVQFPISPSENWAHDGYGRKAGVSGFHCGTGSGMAGIEIEQDFLRDAIVDLSAARGVGVNGVNVSRCAVHDNQIELELYMPFAWTRRPVVVFRRAEPTRRYRVLLNGAEAGSWKGTDLEKGIPLSPTRSLADRRHCHT